MKENEKINERWSNPEPPKVIKKECFPPVGITRLYPRHFRLWRKPYFYTWWWWRPVCCCCCCDEKASAPATGCSVLLELEKNVFGPGKSIHVVVAPGIYFAEFYLKWSVSGVSGQVTVDLELISGPVPVPRLLADNRGANDHFLFSTTVPGSYLFKATATDASGNTCFDTVQVDVPAI